MLQIQYEPIYIHYVSWTLTLSITTPITHIVVACSLLDLAFSSRTLVSMLQARSSASTAQTKASATHATTSNGWFEYPSSVRGSWELVQDIVSAPVLPSSVTFKLLAVGSVSGMRLVRYGASVVTLCSLESGLLLTP